MLTEKEIEDKLRKLPEVFADAVKKKEYQKAKHAYDTAVNVAACVEMSEEFKEELFGKRGDRGVILKKGAFPEEDVQKVYYETSVKK